MKKSKLVIPGVLLAVCLILIGFLVVPNFLGKSSSSARATEADVVEVFKEYKENEEDGQKKYGDKVLKISELTFAYVSEGDTVFEYVYYPDETGTGYVNVTARFAASEDQKIAKIKKGDTVSFTGTISEAQPYLNVLVFDDCHLVS